MFESFVIMLREGIEAALVIGINRTFLGNLMIMIIIIKYQPRAITICALQ